MAGMRRFLPGLQLADGSIIIKIGQRRVGHGYFYKGEEGKEKLARRLVCRVRMDVRKPDGTMMPEKWFHVRLWDEITRGTWDGKTVHPWAIVNPPDPEGPNS
jgi:hypothetical protein